MAFFRSVLAANPDELTALNMVGAILCIQDDPEAATGYFERALRISPDFVAARKNLAIAEFELRHYAAAEEHLQVLLELPEAQGQARLFLGMIASESGQHERAVGLLRAAEDWMASQPRALIAFARSLRHVGQRDKALEVLDLARSRDDLTGADLVDAAQVAVAAGRFDQGLADLERAEALDSDLSGIGVRRVEILVQAGRHEDALALARLLAEETPGGALLSLIAELAEAAGDLDGAVMALRRAIQVEPHSEDRYIELSEFCVRYRNSELALEILDLGSRRIANSYRLLVQRGITLGEVQRYDEARKAFATAIGLTPDHSVALTALAVCLILSEEMSEALKALGAGVDRFPHDFYMHYIYGFALDRARAEQGGRAREALAEEHLRRSIELNKAFPSAHYRLGKLLAEREPATATRHLEAAVRLDPQLTAAKYQLGQLYLDSGRLEDGERLMQEVGEAKQRALEQEQVPQFRAVRTAPAR